MIQELIYTSAAKGLKAGSSGFCTVACTRGMAPNYVDVLESLSAYKFASSTGADAQSPIAFSHYRIKIGGRAASVISRIAPHGVDHTHRANKLAHHVVLPPETLPHGGPAWLLEQAGVMVTGWKSDSEPKYLEAKSNIPDTRVDLKPCKQWERVAGDAGWAGVLAQHVLDFPDKQAYIIFPAGMEMLPLIREATLLVEPGLRWKITFNTYFNRLPIGASCIWRCCLEDSDALKEIRRTPDLLVIDLTSKLGAPPSGPLVDPARTGIAPEPSLRKAVAQAPARPTTAHIMRKKKTQPAEIDEELVLVPDTDETQPGRKRLPARPVAARTQTTRPKVIHVPYVAIILSVFLVISVVYNVLQSRNVANLNKSIQEYDQKIVDTEDEAKKGIEKESIKRKREIGKLKEDNENLKQDMKKSNRNTEWLEKENKRQKGEIEKFKRDLDKAILKANKATERLAQNSDNEAKKPPVRKTDNLKKTTFQGKATINYFVRFEEFTSVIKQLKDKGEASLSVDGLTPEYGKVELFRENENKPEKLEGNLEFHGVDTSNSPLMILSLLFANNRLDFKMGDGVLAGQLDQLSFDRIWKMNLLKGKNRVVIFTKTHSLRESAVITLKKGDNQRAGKCSVNVGENVPSDYQVIFRKHNILNSHKEDKDKKYRISAERNRNRLTIDIEIFKKSFDKDFNKRKGEKLCEKIERTKQTLKDANKNINTAKGIYAANVSEKVTEIDSFISELLSLDYFDLLSKENGLLEMNAEVMERIKRFYEKVRTRRQKPWDKLKSVDRYRVILSYAHNKLGTFSKRSPLPKDKSDDDVGHVLRDTKTRLMNLLGKQKEHWDKESWKYFNERYKDVAGWIKGHLILIRYRNKDIIKIGLKTN